MTEQAVDYSSGHPGGAALKAAGKVAALRYLSTPGNPKNLTRSEADDLAAHGVWCAVVFETTAQRAGAGRAAGVTDAQRAISQAITCGKPTDRPIYFAVDYDAEPAAVAPYFQGLISVLGVSRVGGYGGYRVIKYLLDNRLITYAWQTVAWSGGKWDPRAHIRQLLGTQTINGVSCDRDVLYATDYGQWKPGVSPVLKEEDMSNLDDKFTLPAGTYGSTKPETASGWQWLAYGNAKAGAALAEVQELRNEVASLKAALPQIDYAKLALALIQAAKGA